MPHSPLHPCTYPGCSTLVRRGRCQKHSSGIYTPDYHDPASQRLYNTARWKKRRDRQLAREPWCRACERLGMWTPATVADHIIPHRGDPTLFYGGELQSLCDSCHSHKTAIEVGLFLPKGRGDEKAGGIRHDSAPGLPYEKNSQCGESV